MWRDPEFWIVLVLIITTWYFVARPIIETHVTDNFVGILVIAGLYGFVMGIVFSFLIELVQATYEAIQEDRRLRR